MVTPTRTEWAEAVPLPLGSAAPGNGADQLAEAATRAGLDQLPADSILRTFHPAVASWFLRRFPSGPTEPQRRAWPAIATGSDVLVASPTGTGKTLTGFLVAIDAAYRAHAAGGPVIDPTSAGPGVVYVSPLRAPAADIHENLKSPLPKRVRPPMSSRSERSI